MVPKKPRHLLAVCSNTLSGSLPSDGVGKLWRLMRGPCGPRTPGGRWELYLLVPCHGRDLVRGASGRGAPWGRQRGAQGTVGCTIACYMSHLSLGLGSVEKIGLLVSQVESSQVLSININRYVTLGIKQE